MIKTWLKKVSLLTVLTVITCGIVQAEKKEAFGDWAKACGSDGSAFSNNCFIFQNLVYQEKKNDKSTQKELMKLAVGFYKEKSQPIGVLVLPTAFNIAFARDITVSVNNTELPFKVITCNPVSCVMRIEFEEKMISAFKKHNKAIVKFHSIQGQPYTLPLSLRGFSAGLVSIESKSIDKAIANKATNSVESTTNDKNTKERITIEVNTPTNDTVTGAPAESTRIQVETKYAKSNNIRLRSGPGTQFNVTASLNKDEKLLVLSKKDGWTQVIVNRAENEVSGWVADFLIKESL